MASAVLAPSLRYVADSLALEWRKQLTRTAHKKYLIRSVFYSTSHLGSMQVSAAQQLAPAAAPPRLMDSHKAPVHKRLIFVLCRATTPSVWTVVSCIPNRVQDVDARLTRDVERLSDGLSQLIPSMVKPVVDIAWFTVQLARLTGRRGMGILYAYALGGLLILRLVTPDFGALAKQVSSPHPRARLNLVCFSRRN